jgi:homoserine O-succinyltransferase
MPDSAFEVTEQQYLGLLDAASGDVPVFVTRHTMKGVPRTESIAAYIDAEYVPLDDIRQVPPPDLLIVTGSNPIETHIEDEPYWDEMVDLLTWGRQHTSSMLLSCLAAHAGLAIFDGLARQTLATKCTGVFPQDVDPTQPLAANLPAAGNTLPHSRLNTIGVDQLKAAGYHVALGSDLVGWSVATRPRSVDQAQVVLVQGHPEYGPESLLREYQRDVRRYVRGERDECPILPIDCVGPEDSAALESLHERVTTGARDTTMATLVEAFDFDRAGGRAPWTWRALAITLYENWFAGANQFASNAPAANPASTMRSS